MTNAIALISAKVALGGSLALGLLLTPHAIAHADVYAQEVGDDNNDGIVMEDESGWDCATMGNRVCGGYTMIVPNTDGSADTYTNAIALSDLPNVDLLPTCATETGEGTASSPCVWTSKAGNAYLTYPEYSLLIIDNTVR